MSVNHERHGLWSQADDKVHELVKGSFRNIAPFWPLQNLIAVNPLQGFEDLPIEEALKRGSAYFEQADLPQEMLSVNVETIKWLSMYCDEGQATIAMPHRSNGLYQAWRFLAPYDKRIHKNKISNIEYLKNLPDSPEQVILECLNKLGLIEERDVFLTLLLTTLPGWASYIKYKSEWADESINLQTIKQVDYIAVRIIIVALLWPEAKQLLIYHREALATSKKMTLERIELAENAYRIPLLKEIAKQRIQKPQIPDAHLVFCIDVRSEPFRRSLESIGNYQTLGFAGFFGIPIRVTDAVSGNSFASCPVLVKPEHEIFESYCSLDENIKYKKHHNRKQFAKRIYQSLKYTFTTPFALVEALGGLVGIWMGIRTISPNIASKVISFFNQNRDINHHIEPSIDGIPFNERCSYAENILRMMGLTDFFAPLIVLCGHGSSTQNNAYATALDCGACGGRHGGSNAKVLAAIMNCSKVREELSKRGIHIPKATSFVAAEHNTTTDSVVLFSNRPTQGLEKLRDDLERARSMNSHLRLKRLDVKNHRPYDAQTRAADWAQVRPEWGLARNSAFIIGPRDMTSKIDLEGRCFLHSYDYKQDLEGKFLTSILTAPMVVAEWINMQYLFSTINNVAYGGGSKITKNITGKIGIMQGNASDLMNGLPLQSLYQTDSISYHEPQRLMVVIRASKVMLNKILQTQPMLQKLFGHGWVQMAVIEPDNKIYLLNRGLLWEDMNHQKIHATEVVASF